MDYGCPKDCRRQQICVGERTRERHRGRVQSSGERKGKGESQCCRGWAARMLQSTGSRVRTQWSLTHGARARAEGGGCAGRIVVFVVLLLSLSLCRRVVIALPSVFTVTQTRTRREAAEEKQTRAVTPPVKNGGYAGGLPRLRVHEHDGNPENPP